MQEKWDLLWIHTVFTILHTWRSQTLTILTGICVSCKRSLNCNMRHNETQQWYCGIFIMRNVFTVLHHTGPLTHGLTGCGQCCYCHCWHLNISQQYLHSYGEPLVQGLTLNWVYGFGAQHYSIRGFKAAISLYHTILTPISKNKASIFANQLLSNCHKKICDIYK